MAKSLKELILGAENQALAHEAIKRAVARAEAAGLPPAYLTASGDMAWLKKDPARLLEQRRAARIAKMRQDELHRQRHRLILRLIDGPQGQWIQQKAHEQIDKWERNQLCLPRYWVAWREWLAMPSTLREEAILREDDLGVAMRQNSPFDHSFHLVEQELSKWVQANEKH